MVRGWTKEERRLRAQQRRAEAELAMEEHRKAQEAFHQNRERLKAAREAVGKATFAIRVPDAYVRQMTTIGKLLAQKRSFLKGWKQIPRRTSARKSSGC
jgi:hypothetical protein